MTINIEITRQPDTEALAAIHRSCFETPWDAQAIAELLYYSGTQALVAQDYTGFALTRTIYDELEILTLAVSPEHRRHGIGKALLEAILNWAREKGVKTIFLEVRISNEAAQELYKNAGFELLNTRKDYYRNADGTHEDAAVMRKKLESE
ncbi:MAG TPA: ribosomal protein S18-alanine N-acetyltransferase [Rickettsiales bacterium]|nr:ribosomal protein S18-alanine N-acetyltransferase [Rickettsiales bacterium]